MKNKVVKWIIRGIGIGMFLAGTLWLLCKIFCYET